MAVESGHRFCALANLPLVTVASRCGHDLVTEGWLTCSCAANSSARSNDNRKRNIGLLIAFFATSLVLGQAYPTSFWYGGDPNGVGGLASERNMSVVDAMTCDDFDVTSPQTASFVSGRFYSDIAVPSGFDVEIRTGVSPFNGGTLVTSLQDVRGCWYRQPLYDAFGWNSYLAVVDISLALSPGKYWLALSVTARAAHLWPKPAARTAWVVR